MTLLPSNGLAYKTVYIMQDISNICNTILMFAERDSMERIDKYILVIKKNNKTLENPKYLSPKNKNKDTKMRPS